MEIFGKVRIDFIIILIKALVKYLINRDCSQALYIHGNYDFILSLKYNFYADKTSKNHIESKIIKTHHSNIDRYNILEWTSKRIKLFLEVMIFIR